MTTDPMDAARAAANTLTELTDIARHDVAIVLGSGWVPAIDALGGSPQRATSSL